MIYKNVLFGFALVSAVAVMFSIAGCNDSGVSGGTPNTYMLTVNTEGNGSGTVTKSVNGSTTTATSFNDGTVVTLIAQANSNSTFGGWSGAGCSGVENCVVTMTQARTVTATFTELPAGGNKYCYWTAIICYLIGDPYCSAGTCSEQGCENNYGTVIEDCDNPPVIYALTVNAAGDGSGSVAKSVNGVNTNAANFASGTVVRLTAQAYPGSEFGGWSGEGCSGTGTCTVTMTQARTVTATFTELPVDKYCYWDGDTPSCHLIGGPYCDAGTCTEQECESSYGTVIEDCDNPSGTFEDTRPGGQGSFKWVRIGTQVWMAENLNYGGPNNDIGVCYAGDTSNCTTYGRLYNWATVMNGLSGSSSSPSGRQGICPSGWHVPSDGEWGTLVRYVDPNASGNFNINIAGTKLKSRRGWRSNGNGTDDYGFSALPGGNGSSGGGFNNVGYNGDWWSATDTEGVASAWRWRMHYNLSDVFWDLDNKSYRFSLRCVQDVRP